MKYFLKIAQNINVLPVLMKLQHNPDFWTADTYMRTFPQGPFGEVDSVICRFPPRAVCATQEEADALMATPGYDQHECVDQDIYGKLPEVRQLVMNLFGFVGGTRLGRVIINRVKPGGRVYKHADTFAHANYWQRHHICLQSANGVEFTAGDESVWMAPGEAWWFDNGKGKVEEGRPEHEVVNNSAIDRIHLIVDIKI
jgi:hypothetical protein